MRVNIYSQELTNEVSLTDKVSDTGIVYSAVKFMLHSSDRLHNSPTYDDRSAIVFWLPKSPERREALAKTFEEAAGWVRNAPSETGLD